MACAARSIDCDRRALALAAAVAANRWRLAGPCHRQQMQVAGVAPFGGLGSSAVRSRPLQRTPRLAAIPLRRRATASRQRACRQGHRQQRCWSRFQRWPRADCCDCTQAHWVPRAIRLMPSEVPPCDPIHCSALAATDGSLAHSAAARRGDEVSETREGLDSLALWSETPRAVAGDGREGLSAVYSVTSWADCSTISPEPTNK